MKRKVKEKAQEQTPESKAQCIKLQLKGMIETLYMRHATDQVTALPLMAMSVYNVPIAAVMFKRGCWHLYVTIGAQCFGLMDCSLDALYKTAMKELS